VQYFIPVILGKTLRHVAIAYAGYYAISGDISSVVDNTSMNTLLSSVGFIVIVFGIALIAWLVRTYLESEPDPFLLNFTFFAFAGQCILTAELVREEKHVGTILVLLVPAVILLLLQIWTMRAQVEKTRERYQTILEENKIGDCSSDEIERWSNVLERITGVDFFPEFYLRIIKVGSPREKRRRQAISILPQDKFRIGKDGINSVLMMVPPSERQFLWRCYAIICALSWAVFIACIVVARWHQ
jgi:hypothetical protein